MIKTRNPNKLILIQQSFPLRNNRACLPFQIINQNAGFGKLIPSEYLMLSSTTLAYDLLYKKKKAMRAAMLLKRHETSKRVPEAGILLRDQLLSSIKLPQLSCVAFYVPQKSEIDPFPLAQPLLAAGHRLCLPLVTHGQNTLIFRSWNPADMLEPGPLAGILQPLITSTPVDPNIFLIPLLAFDRHGYRLGYGGGYYDRTLAQRRSTGRILAVGLGFSAQEVASVPNGHTDQVLDALVTESGVF